MCEMKGFWKGLGVHLPIAAVPCGSEEHLLGARPGRGMARTAAHVADGAIERTSERSPMKRDCIHLYDTTYVIYIYNIIYIYIYIYMYVCMYIIAFLFVV